MPDGDDHYGEDGGADDDDDYVDVDVDVGRCLLSRQMIVCTGWQMLQLQISEHPFHLWMSIQ